MLNRGAGEGEGGRGWAVLDPGYSLIAGYHAKSGERKGDIGTKLDPFCLH